MVAVENTRSRTDFHSARSEREALTPATEQAFSKGHIDRGAPASRY